MDVSSIQKAEEIQADIEKKKAELKRAQEQSRHLQPGLIRARQAEKRDEEELKRLETVDRNLANEIMELTTLLKQLDGKLARAKEAMPRGINTGGLREAA